jgi:hypothetical protein
MSKTINYNINFTGGTISLSGNAQTLGNLFTTGGNVGINTPNPTNTLHVNGELRVTNFITTSNLISSNITSNNLVTTNITANGLVSLKSTRGILIGTSTDLDTGRFISALENGLANNQVRWITWGQGTSNNNQAEIGFDYIGPGNTANSLLLGFFNNQVMRIQAKGFVGLGTASPSNTLHINGSLRVNELITTSNLMSINITSTNVITTNFMSVNITATNFISSNITATNLVTSNLNSTNLTASGISTGTLTASGLSSLQTATASGISTGTLTASGLSALQNVTATSVSSSSLYSSIISSGNLSSTNSTTINFIASNVTSNSLVTSNITANGLVSFLTTRGILIGTSTNIDDGRFISALDSGLGNNQIRFIAFGQATSTNNQAELGFRYIGSGNTANSLNLGLFGSQGIRIQANGNVGIGTTSPSLKLDIFASTADNTMRIQNNNALGYASILYEASGSTWASGVGGSTATNFANRFYIAGPISNFVGLTNGNWGINTISPTNTLHVNGGLLVTDLITASNLIASNVTSNNLVTTNITANGIVSLRSTRGILIGTSNNIDDNRFISALDSGLANNSFRSIVFGQAAGTNNQAELGFNYIGSGNTANSLTLGLYGGEKMRIQASGRVGINTPNPASTFHTVSLGPATGNILAVNGSYPNAAYIGALRNASFYSTVAGGTGGISIDKDSISPTDNHVLLRTSAQTGTGFNFILAQTGLNPGYGFQNGNTGSSPSDVFVVRGNGFVGIGGGAPEYPLHVVGSALFTLPGGYSYLNRTTITGIAEGQGGSYSIYSSRRIAAEEFNAFSDYRIKENIQDIDDLSALNILRLIQPKKYNYIDKISRGQKPVWGFIAQQVRSVLDYSTGIIKDYIPNIYDIAAVIVIDNISYLKLKVKTTEGLISTTTGAEPIKIKLFVDDKNTVFEATLKDIIDESTFTINESLTQTEVFIYGIQVSDFHTLNKDAIYTINVAATQELDRELQELRTKIAVQETLLQEQSKEIKDIKALLLTSTIN